MKKVLLLHGALGSQAQLQSIKVALSEQFDVYTLNFSGHGGADMPSQYNDAVFIQDILAFLDDHKIGSINIFGYSMGGYVALHLAALHPERVEKVFTLATKFDWTPESAAQEVKFLNADKILAKVPHFAAALEKRHHPQDWKLVLEKTAEMMLDLGDGNGLQAEHFKAIQHPVMITVGSKDHMVSLAESQNVVEQLENGQLFVFEGFKHPIEKVNVDILTKEIGVFLG